MTTCWWNTFTSRPLFAVPIIEWRSETLYAFKNGRLRWFTGTDFVIERVSSHCASEKLMRRQTAGRDTGSSSSEEQWPQFSRSGWPAAHSTTPNACQWTRTTTSTSAAATDGSDAGAESRPSANQVSRLVALRHDTVVERSWPGLDALSVTAQFGRQITLPVHGRPPQHDGAAEISRAPSCQGTSHAHTSFAEAQSNDQSQSTRERSAFATHSLRFCFLFRKKKQCYFLLDASATLLPGQRQHAVNARWLYPRFRCDPSNTSLKRRRHPFMEKRG